MTRPARAPFSANPFQPMFPTMTHSSLTFPPPANICLRSPSLQCRQLDRSRPPLPSMIRSISTNHFHCATLGLQSRSSQGGRWARVLGRDSRPVVESMNQTISLVDLTRGGTLSCMMGCPLVCGLPLQPDRMPSAIASFPVQPHSARVLVGDAHFFHARADAVPVFRMLRYPLVEDPIGYRSFPPGSDPLAPPISVIRSPGTP